MTEHEDGSATDQGHVGHVVLIAGIRWAGGLLAGALTLAGSGCGFDEARDNAASPILGAGISDEIDALAVLDPGIHDKIDDCIDSAKFKSFNGDPEWRQVWIDGGETVFGLRKRCEYLAKNRPDEFAAIHAEWAQWQRSTGAES